MMLDFNKCAYLPEMYKKQIVKESESEIRK